MNDSDKASWLNISAWLLAVIVLSLAIIAWGQALRWQIYPISTYKLFPVFGLIAFSLMWAHYVIGVGRQILKVDRAQVKLFFEITSFLVLVAILLHPGLLVYQLMRDGFGWPPGSYIHNYVAPTLEWAALLGTVSWFLFLSYELRRWFKNRGWWKFVQMASDAAMIAILFHSLYLGTQLKHGWLRQVWLFYGLTLIVSLIYIYYHKLKIAKTPPSAA